MAQGGSCNNYSRERVSGPFFSPGECFILESRVNDVTLGESEEDRDLLMFLGASAGPGVQMARDAILAQLKTLDDTLEGLRIRGSVDKWVHVHSDRVQILFNQYLWPEADHFSAWMAGVKVVVCTADQLRNSFQCLPSWAQDRSLDVVCVDEAEQLSGVELMCMAGHFQYVLAAGDEMQRVRLRDVWTDNMPSSDPVGTQHQHESSSVGDGPASSSSTTGSVQLRTQSRHP